MTLHKESVKSYYGKILKSNTDLKTSACCSISTLAPYQKHALSLIEPEILDTFYGCGCPIPPGLEGRTVLDLGCGTGRDVFMLSYLVGEKGRVYGIDMTDEQLDVAKKYEQIHSDKFGYQKLNTTFIKGYIEELSTAGIADNSIDLVVSNCVINLSPNKPAIFSEIFRVLKPGGELYFSDVFSDRRLPYELQEDPVLLGECLAGALYIEDFRRYLQRLGCFDFRCVSSTPIAISDQRIKDKIGFASFNSLTLRAFKLDLEDRCEDYGQVATYLGTLPHFPHHFILDDHHVFQTHKPMLVCGNTADMLSKTGYRNHVNVVGSKNTHFGLFDGCSESNTSEKSSIQCC